MFSKTEITIVLKLFNYSTLNYGYLKNSIEVCCIFDVSLKIFNILLL